MAVSISNDVDVSLVSGDPSTTFSGSDLLNRSPLNGIFNPDNVPLWKVRDDLNPNESLDVYLDFVLDLETGVTERVINSVVLVGRHGNTGQENSSENIEVWVVSSINGEIGQCEVPGSTVLDCNQMSGDTIRLKKRGMVAGDSISFTAIRIYSTKANCMDTPGLLSNPMFTEVDAVGEICPSYTYDFTPLFQDSDYEDCFVASIIHTPNPWDQSGTDIVVSNERYI